MGCPATPQNPCMCACHHIIVESEVMGSRPLYGCNECSDGQKLKPTPTDVAIIKEEGEQNG